MKKISGISFFSMFVSMLVLLLAGCGGAGSTSAPATSLVSIQVSSDLSNIANGSTQQFTATANYSDNTTQDFTSKVLWISSNTAVATISSSGLATGVAVGGPVTILATFGGMSGTATLTSTPAKLVSIQVTPAVGGIVSGTTQQFTAIGNYSDKTTQDLTTSVLWTSSNQIVATVNSTTGFATGMSAGGPVTITASYGGVTGTGNLEVTAATLVSIQVTPMTPSIAKGVTQQFTAIGNYNNGTTQDLTATVLWTSSNSLVANINASGVATGVMVGAPVTITATTGGISGTTSLAVTAATLVTIQVTPVAPSIAKGTAQQLAAIGNYSDNTTQDLTTTASWVSGSPTMVNVSASGRASGLAVTTGSVAITATYSGVTGTSNLTVTPATLSNIGVRYVTPTGWPSSTIFTNSNMQLIATGFYSDGSNQNLSSVASWVSSNLGVATISPTGLATGVTVGPVSFTATFNGLSSSISIAVDSVRMIYLELSSAAFHYAIDGQLRYLSAYGRFNNYSLVNYSSVATWTSSNPATATVAPGGNITGVAPGTTLIQASYNGFTNAVLLTIDAIPPPPINGCLTCVRIPPVL